MKKINGSNSLSLLLLLCLVCIAVQSHSTDWQGPDFEYYADGEQLKELLTSFASSYSVPIFVSEKINDKVNGHLEKRKPMVFLDYIARVYNLTWYYDGAVLYIYKNNEIRSEIIRLNFLSSEHLRRSLQSTGIWDSRFYWRSINDKSLLYVAGPPRYVDLVKKTAAVLEQQLSLQQDDELYIDIIPLNYASATDRVISFRDRTIDIPGVASVLNTILRNMGAGKQSPPAVHIYQQTEQPTDSTQYNTLKPLSNQSAISEGHNQAVIQAAPYNNAIIVRDHRSRMPLYRRLIDSLDKPQRRVELGVYIIDISAEDLDQLGVEWRGGVDVSGNTFIDLATTGNQDSNGLNLGNGTQFSAILNPTSNQYFLTKIRFLQTRGAAQIVSRPTLLTQENITAILDNNTTFFVKLEGQEEVGLEQVEFGTLIHMLPRVHSISGEDKPYINLSLHIEDGNQIQDGDVGGLPSVRRTVLDTETRVKQGQSLLIGGIYQDRLEKSVRKVPVLGSIPLIGALFRSKSTTVRKTVRMFLIEPRIIDTPLDNPNVELGFMPTVNIEQQMASASLFSNSKQCTDKDQAQLRLDHIQERGEKGRLVRCDSEPEEQGWRAIVCRSLACEEAEGFTL